MKSIFLIPLILLSACTLTPDQQAKLNLAETQVANLGDKLLRIGLLTGKITPEEAAAARAIGAIVVSPAPSPTTSAKQPVIINP